MVVTDHINFMGTNPLRGCGNEASQPLPRFVDLTRVLRSGIERAADPAGRTARVKLQRAFISR